MAAGSDERLRELERSWAESQTPEAGAAVLLERVRCGLLPRHLVQLLAHLREPAARVALELPPQVEFKYQVWIQTSEGVHHPFMLEEDEAPWEQIENWGVVGWWLRPKLVKSLKRPELFREVTGLQLEKTSDAHLASVAKLPGLKWLRVLRSPKVTDAGLSGFAGCGLERLELDGCERLFGEGLGALGRGSLVVLIARDTPLQSLEGLESCESLAHLTLERTEVTDLAPLAALPLRTLSLVESSSVSSLKPLYKHSGLLLLDLSRTLVHPDELGALLSANPKLQVLRLAGMRDPNRALAQASLPALSHLDLRPHGAGYQGIFAVVERLPTLRSLDAFEWTGSHLLEEVIGLRRSLGRPSLQINGVQGESFQLRRAVSGRARCQQCREKIAKDSLRLLTQRFRAYERSEDGEGTIDSSYVHPACGAEYLRVTPEVYRRHLEVHNDPETVAGALEQPEIKPEPKPERVLPTIPARPLPSPEEIEARCLAEGYMPLHLERFTAEGQGEFYRVLAREKTADIREGRLGGTPKSAMGWGPYQGYLEGALRNGFQYVGRACLGLHALECQQVAWRQGRRAGGFWGGLESPNQTPRETAAPADPAALAAALESQPPAFWGLRLANAEFDLAALAAELPDLEVLDLRVQDVDLAELLSLWPRLRHLTLGRRADTTQAAISHPELRSLTFLSGLSAATAKALANGSWPALELLQLDISDEQVPGLEPLFRSPPPELRRVSARTTNFGQTSCSAFLLIAAHKPMLERVEVLQLAELGDEGLGELRSLVPVLPRLSQLRVSEPSSKGWKRGTKKKLKETLPLLDHKNW